jgi:diguanylate cyclase (GGDEF)-like protein
LPNVSPSARPPAAVPPAAERNLGVLVGALEALDLEKDEAILLPGLLDAVASGLGVARGALFLEAGGGPLTLAAERGAADSDDAWASLVEAARQSSTPLVRPSARAGWSAAIPVLGKAGLLGVMVAGEGGAHPAPALDVLRVLGRQLGFTIEAARRCAELRAASGRAEVLHRISVALASGPELRSILPAFAGELASVVEFDRLACGFVNDSGDYIEVATHPENTSWGFGTVLPLVGSGLGSALLNGQRVTQTDLVHSHRFIEDMRLLEEGLRSYVVLPLFTRGRTIGVLGLARREADAFTSATVERLEPIVAGTALALENVRLLQKTRELSITDEVTPLFNFRFFHQILDRELKLVDRYRSVLSLLFMDLDRFKPINDTYGHLRGSRVLREVGFLVRAAVRETDYPARYGGDEFVVILPQTDGAAARMLASKLRRLIEGHRFLQEEGINASIGVSVGIATYPAEASSKEALIRLADERMYLDKEGRKRE